MAIDCNDIHTVAAELKERFTPCYKLTAADMDELVDLIAAVELCVSTGTGFMTKSIYDTNDDGIVENSDLVNGLTVETAVPPGAVFTDTIVDISGKEDDLGLPSINGQVLSSTVTGIRSWVNTIAGGGDMTTAIYDTNNNNVVDNAELVNGLSVETSVPSGAIFTDTVYDDTAVYAAIALKEDALGNPASTNYVLTSTTGGTRSWIPIPASTINLAFTPSPTSGLVTNSAGTDATILLADATNAGLMSPAEKVLLNNQSGINTGDSDTNLGYSAAPNEGTVTSSDGTNATIPAADATNAGLILPAEKVLLNNQSGINTGDQDLSNYPELNASNVFTGVNNTFTRISADWVSLAPTVAGTNFEIDDVNSPYTGWRISAGSTQPVFLNATLNSAIIEAAHGSAIANTQWVRDYFEPAKGVDDNFVTDAEKVVIGNTSGTNTGDQDLSNLVSEPTESTGVALVLSDPIGRPYNMGSASNGLTYTTSGLTPMGWAVCRINAASQPTVTGGTLITGATFAASTDMHMVVQTLDGIVVQYYFIEL